MFVRRSLKVSLLLICVYLLLIATEAEAVYHWETCKTNVQRIIDGSNEIQLSDGTVVSNVTIHDSGFLYDGRKARGFDQSNPGPGPLTVTYLGTRLSFS